MKTRYLRLLALLLLLCTAACGPAGGGSSTPLLRIWYSTDDPVERGWAGELATRFMASHPGVRVQLTAYSFEDLNTKLQLALSAGDPPDLAYVTPRGPGIPAYVGAHRLLDLTADARRLGWAQRLRPGLLAQYNSAFPFYGAAPRSISAVPSSLAAAGVLYNARLLQALHLTVPRTAAAFGHALAVARAAGDTPLGMGNADGWVGDDWYLTLVNAAVPPATLQPEQRLSPSFTFQQPPLLGAAATLRRWSAAGYFTQNFGGLDAQEGLDLFFAGHTLFQLVSSSENAQIMHDAAKTHLSVGVFAYPATSGGTVMPDSGYLGWVVPKGGSQPRLAVQFINSMVSPGTAQFLLSHGVLPAVRTVGSGGVLQRPAVVTLPRWQREYLQALNTAVPGVYLDAAPLANINATMEANVQLLLQGYEPASFLVKSLQEVYASHGKHGSTARIDGEF